MQFFQFIFLKRKWESDKETLNKSLKRISLYKSDDHVCILVFPEGTIIHPNTIENSLDFAKKEGLKPFERVLIPRTTGLSFLLENYNNVSAVYDVTMGYEIEDRSVLPEHVVTLGRIFAESNPVNVHFLCRRLSIDGVKERLETKEAFSTFLYNVFKIKNENMKQFVEHGRFQEEYDLTVKVGESWMIPRIDRPSYALIKVWLTWFCLISIYFLYF